MPFSDTFLTSLVQFNVIGDFPPFTNGDILQVEKYVNQLVTKLKEHPYLLVSQQETYSSFIGVKVSKADKSDTQLTQQGITITEKTTGLCLYFCTLAPYWFYGACDWSTNWIGYVGGSSTGGSSYFLEPGSSAQVDHSLWKAEIEAIEAVVQAFRYTLLSPATLAQPAPIDLDIHTIIGDEPYRIFDCFFYWED